MNQETTFELAAGIQVMRIVGRLGDHGLPPQENQGFWGKEYKKHHNRAVFRGEPSGLRVYEHSGFPDKNYRTRARPRSSLPTPRGNLHRLQAAFMPFDNTTFEKHYRIGELARGRRL